MRWQDLLVISLNLGVMVAIGVYCARKTRSSDSYFLADRSMPGWVVGFSMMATIVSSMTFLAIPAATYKDDWRFIPPHVLYIFPAMIGYFVVLPFFRGGHVRTAYEYLELRFGTWARIFGAVTFLFYHMFRVGVILYVVSVALQEMTGFPMIVVITVVGILVAAYTVAGGLEAVIYTDFLQGLALIIGGLICTPIIAHLLPGGWEQIFTEAYENGKFGVGSTEFVFDKKTIWVIILVYQFEFLRLVCADQAIVQRYLAMKTEQEARRGFMLSTILVIPTWAYFGLIGTALYVYYRNFPEQAPAGGNPEAVFPHFILTHVPAGVAGFVIAGLLAAAMSTLDSSINASAATVTTDFYRRFRPDAGDEKHFLRVGRVVSIVFAVIMIGIALCIHFTRTETLMDLQTVVYPILTAGVLSLFLLGFLTVRVGSRAAAIATTATVLFVVIWVPFTTDAGKKAFPSIAAWFPNEFWIGVLPHVVLLSVGYLLSFLLPQRPKPLKNLTIWTRAK